MSKYVKRLLVEDLKKRFKGVNEFLVISVKGVDGNENNQIRGELLGKGIKLNVVKNSAIRAAFSNLGTESAGGLFSGPCTIAWGGESVVDVAREIVGWSKKVTSIEFKGAFLEGEVLDAAGALALSKMSNKSELQGEISMLANSPGRRLAGSIIGPAGIIAGCIKAISEESEKAA